MKTRTRPKTHKRSDSKTASAPVLADDFGRAKKRREHYLELARASEQLGDHVATESLYQFAEHYSRLMASKRQGSQRHSKETQLG
jgi:Domain of unknown function (DUF4167)